MNLMALKAVLSLDKSQYEKGLSESKKNASKIGAGIKKALGVAGKITGAGLAAGVAGIVTITKKAVDAFADYEQLVGGVETLFKGSADKVKKYASEAYKTAGLSANDYMETVTSFSASLLQSLGGDTDKAAEAANQAVIDMSDNANKMGTEMQRIQDAYQGFAKQNYTMLDNLKLGYGGTKQEMERLLADAEKLSGKKFDISSFADIVEAIHVVQDEMGITGTTAKEASDTISGSLNAVKAAWQNLLVGFADGNQDIGKLMDNLVEAVGNAAKNLIPRIKQAFLSITRNIGDLAGKLVSSFFGEKTGAAVKKTIDTIMRAVRRLFDLLEKLSPIIDTAMNFISELVSNILPPLVDIIETILPIIIQITDIITKSLISGIKIIGGVLKVIGAILKPIMEILKPLLDVIGLITDGIGWLADGFAWLISGCPQVADGFEEVVDAADELVASIDNTLSSWEQMIETQREALTSNRSEIDQTRKLKKELDTLVDANGRVKKGYESRAEYVANKLTEVSGVEVQIIDGEVQKYKELSKAIEESIQQKKIAALRDYYDTIISEASKTLPQTKQDLADIEDQLDDLHAKMDGTSKDTDEYNQMLETENALLKEQEKYQDKIAHVTDANIELKKLEEAVAKKDYKTVNKLMRDHTEMVVKDGEEHKSTTQDKIKNNTAYRENLEINLQKAKEAGDQAAVEEYERLIKQSDKTITELQDRYEKEQSVTKTGLNKILGDVDVFGRNTRSKMSNVGLSAYNALVNGLRSGTGISGAASSVMSEIYTNLSPNGTKLSWIGEMIIEGVLRGMRNKMVSAGNYALSAGADIAAKIGKGAGVSSPSKKTIWIAQMLVEGLKVGWKRSYKQVIDTMSKDMNFRGTMEYNGKISSANGSLLGELLKVVKSIDGKAGNAGENNIYYEQSDGSIDDFARALTRSVVMARRV